MDSVPAIGQKVRGFKPDRGDGFLRATKIRNTPFFGGEVKLQATSHTILRHVKKKTCKYKKILRKAKFITTFARSFCLILDNSAGRIA
jgi:hypothetical protein